MAKKKVGATGLSVSLDNLLDWITKNTYDATHLGGLTGMPEWVVSSVDLLTALKELVGFTDEQMREAYDWARVRVHGPNVKGGR